MDMDLKIFRMNRLGIPQERIAKRLFSPQQTISGHLPKMPVLANPLNSDLERGFTVAQVAGLGNGVKKLKLATYTVGKPGREFKPAFESTAF